LSPAEAVPLDHVLDHLADREGFAAVAADVLRLKPVEAGSQVVGALLLREDESEAIAFGEGRPARALVVSRGCLRAAVQDEDERARGREPVRDEREHSQIAGIGPEPDDLRQDAGRLPRGGGRPHRLVRQPFQTRKRSPQDSHGAPRRFHR